MTVPLDVEDNYCIEAAMSGPWQFGQILIALCYNTKRRSLIVRIDRCTNLMAMDKNGFSDPFIKLYETFFLNAEINMLIFTTFPGKSNRIHRKIKSLNLQ